MLHYSIIYYTILYYIIFCYITCCFILLYITIPHKSIVTSRKRSLKSLRPAECSSLFQPRDVTKPYVPQPAPWPRLSVAGSISA